VRLEEEVVAKEVLIAGFMHETNTFSKLPTDLAAYRARSLYRGAEVPANMRGTKTEIAAFLDAGERHGWRLTHPLFANATPSGKVTREAFETLSGEILAAIDAEGPFDAILLSLHGAMVVEHADDGEGLLLQLIRDKVGGQVPIAVTLDLHANVTDLMADLADVMISYRTYPHVDQYEIASQAADLIHRTLAGEIRPATVVARGAMLDGADHGRTTAPGPMTEVLAAADTLLAEPGVLAASVNAGFPWADIHDTGPTAVIVGDGDDPRYREMAEGLIAEIWAERHRSTVETLGIAQALQRLGDAVAATPGKPVVLADFADNPGGGGYGDATGLLGTMIDAGLENAAFATIYDPAAAGHCTEAGVGATVSLALGGKVDPRYGGPLQVIGKVEALTDGRFVFDGPMMQGTKCDMGPTAVLRVGGIDVVVASARYQAFDRQFFTHAGIEPAEKAVLAVKSAHHFRAAFGPIAGAILAVDAGDGLTSRNYKELPFQRVRRPVYPLDLD
jgi:microcystin degradation protein MlrC